TEHLSASTTLADSTSNPSPVVLTMRPLCAAIFGSITSVRSVPLEPAGPARVEHRLAAILAADVAGYSRLIEADEEGTLGWLKAHLLGDDNPTPTVARRALTGAVRTSIV